MSVQFYDHKINLADNNIKFDLISIYISHQYTI